MELATRTRNCFANLLPVAAAAWLSQNIVLRWCVRNAPPRVLGIGFHDTRGATIRESSTLKSCYDFEVKAILAAPRTGAQKKIY